MGLGDLQALFLRSSGFTVMPFKIPFFAMYFLAAILEIVAFIISPVYTVQSSLSRKIVAEVYHSHSLSHAKASKLLDYKPLFTFEESVDLSKKYYATI